MMLFAKNVITSQKIKSVVDLGCGTPSKLEEFIAPHVKDITGVDAKEINGFLFGKWIVADLEKEIDLKIK